MSYITFDRIDGLTTDHQRRIASIIKDFAPTVRLLKLEPGHPQFHPEKPFALVDEPGLMEPYVIFTMAESEIDARLIARLLDNDTANPDSKASRLQLLEQAEALVRAKAELEWEEEKKDLLKSMMKSKQHTYTHAGKTLRK